MNDKPSPKVVFSDLRIPVSGEIFLARNPSLRDYQLAQLFEVLPNGQAVILVVNEDSYVILEKLEPARVLTINP